MSTRHVLALPMASMILGRQVPLSLALSFFGPVCLRARMRHAWLASCGTCSVATAARSCQVAYETEEGVMITRPNSNTPPHR
ncbi:hypothetical protein LX32DRAFT_38871 [Colletotrichum zoysiae]|uniref:Secreted protein n=1 Tax=Colletotrichum zoysiae TaxID=1216348 RepID=A0AAD9LXG3_9PEZI|nr:hypothetical protein LX32DRAFT_38871 [Colletotrichum zoysiae]